MSLLTWSASRDTALDACERRYFLSYITHARANSRDARLREIAVLKKVQTISMWQGDVFHRLAATYLRLVRDGRTACDPDAATASGDRLLAEALVEMRLDWDASAEGRYRAIAARATRPGAGRRGTRRAATPQISLGFGLDDAATNIESGGAEDRRLALFEHEYRMELRPDAFETARDAVTAWFHRFLSWIAAERFDLRVRQARRIWIEPATFGPTAPGFRSGTVQVLAKVDFAMEEADRRFTVVDWKTGAPRTAAGPYDDDAEYQVTVYQLWPHLTLGVPLDRVLARVVFVAADPIIDRVYTIDAETRERAMRRVARGIRRALALHGSGDHAALAEADFDYARHHAFCRGCGFKRLCQGEQAS
ncbi:MAG: PD-(D/E)XK nuclease family protein [Gemmatimonadota bacterium]|nr:PD-(D/E)XK nuclease family protein [Gemmatimonadota bacterium]